MKKAKMIFNQIHHITSDLVGTPLCIDQNFPIKNGRTWDTCEIEIPRLKVADALKNRSYVDMFQEIDAAKSYNIKLIDGSIIILQYRFQNDLLVAHRLAFFPNPNLSIFQNDPEDYLEDEIYVDVIDPKNVATPLRFDFDCNDEKASPIEHPQSHFTIGQYRNCRIPVNRPITPSQFISFIIRNFYHTAYAKYCDQITTYDEKMDETIYSEEKSIIHLGIV